MSSVVKGCSLSVLLPADVGTLTRKVGDELPKAACPAGWGGPGQILPGAALSCAKMTLIHGLGVASVTPV